MCGKRRILFRKTSVRFSQRVCALPPRMPTGLQLKKAFFAKALLSAPPNFLYVHLLRSLFMYKNCHLFRNWIIPFLRKNTAISSVSIWISHFKSSFLPAKDRMDPNVCRSYHVTLEDIPLHQVARLYIYSSSEKSSKKQNVPLDKITTVFHSEFFSSQASFLLSSNSRMILYQAVSSQLLFFILILLFFHFQNTFHPVALCITHGPVLGIVIKNGLINSLFSGS